MTKLIIEAKMADEDLTRATGWESDDAMTARFQGEVVHLRIGYEEIVLPANALMKCLAGLGELDKRSCLNAGPVSRNHDKEEFLSMARSSSVPSFSPTPSVLTLFGVSANNMDAEELRAALDCVGSMLIKEQGFNPVLVGKR